MPKRRNVLLWTGLTLATLSVAMTGIDMAFNVYAISLKETFNFSQTQVEIMASLGAAGEGVCVLEVFLDAMFGYKFVYLSSWVTIVSSGAFLSVAAKYGHVFHDIPMPVFIAQLIWATGNAVIFMATSRAAVGLIPKNHTGKIIGVLLGAQSFGKVIFCALVDLFFFDDFSGFLCTFTVMSGVIFGLCLITLHVIARNNVTFISNDQSSREEKHHDEIDICQDSTTTTKMLSSAFFHLIFWPSVIYYGCPYSLMNNISTIAESVGLERPLNVIYVLTASLAITRISFGVIFDKFSCFEVGIFLILIANFCLGISLLIGLFWLNSSTVYAMAFLGGIAVGPGFTITVSLLMKQYGSRHYSFLTGCFFGIFFICATVLQVILGGAYDSETRDQVGPTQTFCRGPDCFHKSFCVTGVVLTVVISVEILTCSIRSFTKDRVDTQQ